MVHPHTLLQQKTVQKPTVENECEFTRHAFKRAVERNISDQEIRVAGAQARIIEDYPDDNILRVAYSWALPMQDAPCTCRSHT